MRQEEHLAIDFGRHRRFMHDNSTLFFQITIRPQVVITRKEMHFHAVISQLAKLSQEAGIAFRHHITILIPEIKHISEQINCRSLFLDTVEKTHQSPLLRAAMRYCQRAQMGVTQEINVFTHLIKSKFYTCFFGHHALVPCRFEHQIHIG